MEFFEERTVADVVRCLKEGANPNSRMAGTSLLGAVVHYVAWNDKDRGTAMIVALIDSGAKPDSETLEFAKNMAWGDKQSGTIGQWSKVVAALRGEGATPPAWGSVWERTAVVYGWTAKTALTGCRSL